MIEGLDRISYDLIKILRAFVLIGLFYLQRPLILLLMMLLERGRSTHTATDTTSLVLSQSLSLKSIPLHLLDRVLGVYIAKLEITAFLLLNLQL